MNESYKYSGDELLLFEKAVNWKKYFTNNIIPYIKGNVLEVGAGIGSNTTLLNKYNSATSWTLLEPDESMAKLLTEKKIKKNLPSNYTVINGTINTLSKTLFDTIIYIDVLEHIEKDKEELAVVASLLKPGGHIIIISPAFQFLYSRFDKEIGHYRRYSKKQLKKTTPAALSFIKLKYLDSIGFFASLANRLFLYQSYPSARQIYFWDKWLIPFSKFTDKLFFHSFGKSILAVLKKEI